MSVAEQGGSMILCGFDTQVFKNQQYGDFMIFANDPSTQRILIGLCNVDSNSVITVEPDRAIIQNIQVASNLQVIGDLQVIGAVSFSNSSFEVNAIQNSYGPVNVNGVLFENNTLLANIHTSNITNASGDSITIQGISISNNTVIAESIQNVSLNTSNLTVTGDTTLSGDIIPGADATYRVGIPSFRFKEMYTSSNGLHIGNVNLTNSECNLQVTDGNTGALTRAIVKDLSINDKFIAQVAPNGTLRFYQINSSNQLVLSTPIPNVFSDYVTENIGIGTSNPAHTLTLKDGSFGITNGSNTSVLITSASETLTIGSNIYVPNTATVTNLDAFQAYLTNVDMDVASIITSTLCNAEISNAEIESADIEYALVQQLDVVDQVISGAFTSTSYAYTSNLSASNLRADHATLVTVNATTMNVNELIVPTIWSSNVSTSNALITTTLNVPGTTFTSNLAASNIFAGTLRVTDTSVFDTTVICPGTISASNMTMSNAMIKDTLVSTTLINASNITASNIVAQSTSSLVLATEHASMSNTNITDSLTITAPQASAVTFSVSNLSSSNHTAHTSIINSSFVVLNQATISNLTASNMSVASSYANYGTVTYLNVESNLTVPTASVAQYLNMGPANIAYPNQMRLPDLANVSYATNLASYTGPTDVVNLEIFEKPTSASAPKLFEGNSTSIHRYLQFSNGNALVASNISLPATNNFTIGFGFRLDDELDVNNTITMLSVEYNSSQDYRTEWSVTKSYQSHQVSIDFVTSTNRLPCTFNIDPYKWYYMVYVVDLNAVSDITLYSSEGTIYDGAYALYANQINISPPVEINDIVLPITGVKAITLANNSLTAANKRFSFASSAIYRNPQPLGNVQPIMDYLAAKTTIRAHTLRAMSNLVVGANVATFPAALDVSGDINLTGDLYWKGVVFRQSPFYFTECNRHLYITNGSNLGINTSNPTAPLNVIGNVDATRFRALEYGNSSEPSFTFSNSSNTGMYFDSNTSSLAFTLMGSNIFSLESNVIRSSLPIQIADNIFANNITVNGSLSVSSNLNFNGLLLSNDQPYKSSQFDTSLDRTSVYLQTPSNLVLGANTYGTLSNTLSVWNGVQADRLTVDGDIQIGGQIVYKNGEPIKTSQWVTDGNTPCNVYITESNIGIGTSSPETRLHVIGSTTLDGDIKTSRQMQITGLRIAQTNPQGSPLTVTSTITSIPGFANTSNTIDFTLSNTQTEYRFRTSNYHVIATVTENQCAMNNNYDVTTPEYTWDSDTTTGIYQPANGAIGFACDGMVKATLCNSGLYVSGDIVSTSKIIANSVELPSGASVSFVGHTHDASDIVTGTLLVARGGTGTTTKTGTGDVVLSDSPTLTGSANASNLTACNVTVSMHVQTSTLTASTSTTSPIVNATSSLQTNGTTRITSTGQLTNVQMDTSRITTGVLGVIYGGTGCNTFSSDKLVVGNGTNPLYTSSRLHWDNTNHRLGLGTPSPAYSLHIMSNISSGVVSATLQNTATNAWTSVSLSNDSNQGVSLLMNGSTKIDEGGSNTATLRNDIGDMRVQAKGSVGMVVKADSGFMGVNNATPAYHVDVGGIVRSHRVIQTLLPAFLVVGNPSQQSFSNNTRLVYSTITNDTTSSYNVVNGTYTVPVTGMYYFSAGARTLNRNKAFEIQLRRINGATSNIFARAYQHSNGESTIVSGACSLVSGDVVDVFSPSANQDYLTLTNEYQFSGFLVQSMV